MITDEHELVGEPERPQAGRKSNLRRFINDTVIESPTREQRARPRDERWPED